MNWRDIQRELAKRGFNPGRIDGIPGRNTRKAVEAFQRKMGLEVDGIVGSRTLGALFGPTSAKGRQVADLPWPTARAAIPGFNRQSSPKSANGWKNSGSVVSSCRSRSA